MDAYRLLGQAQAAIKNKIYDLWELYMHSDDQSYREALSPREQLLLDLLNTSIAAALGGDEKRASQIIDHAWKSTESIYPAVLQETFKNVAEDQLKRLLRDAERLNFWQVHDWYTGERIADGEWRFFDPQGEGASCKGASLREALDALRKVQPDVRGELDDADAWEG